MQKNIPFHFRTSFNTQIISNKSDYHLTALHNIKKNILLFIIFDTYLWFLNLTDII